METSSDKPEDTKAQLGPLYTWLRHPIHIRVVTAGILFIVGYGAIYMPLSDKLDATQRNLEKERAQRNDAREIEHLRDETKDFLNRVPDDADSNEWAKYVLDGIRRFPLKFNSMSSVAPKRVPPYTAIVLNIELTGEFRDIVRFVHWLETNERLFRIDSISLKESREGGLAIRLTLLGLTR